MIVVTELASTLYGECIRQARGEGPAEVKTLRVYPTDVRPRSTSERSGMVRVWLEDAGSVLPWRVTG